ncbi:hypothetical protein ABPG77_010942 [Micractinium sp. CCAP 211/92]
MLLELVRHICGHSLADSQSAPATCYRVQCFTGTGSGMGMAHQGQHYVHVINDLLSHMAEDAGSISFCSMGMVGDQFAMHACIPLHAQRQHVQCCLERATA